MVIWWSTGSSFVVLLFVVCFYKMIFWVLDTIKYVISYSNPYIWNIVMNFYFLLFFLFFLFQLASGGNDNKLLTSSSGGRGVGGAISARSSSKLFPSMSPSKKQGAPATTTAGPPQVRSSFGQSKSSPQSALKDMGMGGMVCSPLSAAETMARTNVSRSIPPPAFGHVGGGRSSSGGGGSSSSGVVLGMPPPPQSTTIQQHETSPSRSLSLSRHSTLL